MIVQKKEGGLGMPDFDIINRSFSLSRNKKKQIENYPVEKAKKL